MARLVTSPANAAWNTEGWTRLTTGWEVVLDTTTTPQEGTGSYIVQGDGASKQSFHTFTNGVAGGVIYMQYYLRLAALPTVAGSIAPSGFNGSSFAEGYLYFNASGQLIDVSMISGNSNEEPAPTPITWPGGAGAWVKIVQAFRASTANSHRLEIWTWINDVFFTRTTVWSTGGGAPDRFGTNATSTDVPRVNLDDLKINDSSGVSNNFFVAGNHPEYLTAPGAGGVHTVPTLRSQVDTSTGTGAGATTFVANAPTSIQAGDLLVAVVLQKQGNSSTNLTAPAGWTRKLLRTSVANSAYCVAVFTKVATNSEPSTYTFSSTQSGKWFVKTLSAMNCVDVGDLTVQSGSAAATGATATTPTVYNNDGDCRALFLVAAAVNTGTVTLTGYPATDDQMAYDDPSASGQIIVKSATRQQSAGGFSLGDGSSTLSTTSGSNWLSLQLLLTPSLAGPTQNVQPTAIASGEAFGTDYIKADVGPSGIPSGQAFGSPTVHPIGPQLQAPPGIPSGEAWGNAIVQGHDSVPQIEGPAPALDNTDPYGIDLEITTRGDLALRGRGDLSRVGGARNCAQALVLRLRAYPGELPLHLDYGSLLADQLVGLKQLDVQLARSTANSQARQIIEHDRRFLAIKDVAASFAGPQRVAVALTLRLAGGELLSLDDVAETRVDEVSIDAASQLDTDLDLSLLDAGLIDYDRDDLGEIPDVDLLTGIDS